MFDKSVFQKIENICKPVIGETYLVKCTRAVLAYQIGDFKNWVPVFGDLHDDKGIGQPANHFHVDYRFIPLQYIKEQEDYWEKGDYWPKITGKNKRTFSFLAVTENMIKSQIFRDNVSDRFIPSSIDIDKMIIEEGLHIKYLPMKYLRHFDNIPEEYAFDDLINIYRKKDIRMKNMICPHKKANLNSCEIIDGVVECPCHGLKWDVNTGKLVN